MWPVDIVRLRNSKHRVKHSTFSGFLHSKVGPGGPFRGLESVCPGLDFFCDFVGSILFSPSLPFKCVSLVTSTLLTTQSPTWRGQTLTLRLNCLPTCSLLRMDLSKELPRVSGSKSSMTFFPLRSARDHRMSSLEKVSQLRLRGRLHSRKPD